jgi:exodeoxyribonuclease V alpha subunit
VEKSREILQVESAVVTGAISKLAADRRVVIEELGKDATGSETGLRAVYLARYYLAEVTVADRIKALLTAPRMIRKVDSARAVSWVQQQLGIRLAPNQITAVRSALDNKMWSLPAGPERVKLLYPAI